MGFIDNGFDFGLGFMILIKVFSVVMVVGEGIYSNEVGQVWYYFE